MTDQERTTVHETIQSDPVVRSRPIVRTYSDPATPAPAIATDRTVERTYRPAGPAATTVASRLVILAFGVLQVALILRIVLLLLDANVGNDVVALILGVTDPFVDPFRGMFSFDRVTADRGSVLDVAAVVALIGWSLVEALILAALHVFDRREVVIA
jgi:uncharacterized protein YggT (Ycf19 family)